MRVLGGVAHAKIKCEPGQKNAGKAIRFPDRTSLLAQIRPFGVVHGVGNGAGKENRAALFKRAWSCWADTLSVLTWPCIRIAACLSIGASPAHSDGRRDTEHDHIVSMMREYAADIPGAHRGGPRFRTSARACHVTKSKWVLGEFSSAVSSE